MKLTLIVTHYKEPEQICRPLLESVALQRGIPFSEIEMIFVNDGNEKVFNTAFFVGLPYSVNYIVSDKCGVSAARNIGLDAAKGDYVMFCDCDDRFSNMYGLHMLFSAFEQKLDAITSCFVEEHFSEDEGLTIHRRENEATFIHGKAYRRQYLMDNHIRFNERLTIHEDGFFTCLALKCTENRKNITTPFYSWCWREGSVADKTDDLFAYKTYSHLVATRTALIEEFLKRDMPDEATKTAVHVVVDAYYDFETSKFDKLTADQKVNAYRSFQRFYKRYRDLFCKAKMNDIVKISNKIRAEKAERVETETMSEFIKRMTTINF